MIAGELLKFRTKGSESKTLLPQPAKVEANVLQACMRAHKAGRAHPPLLPCPVWLAHGFAFFPVATEQWKDNVERSRCLTAVCFQQRLQFVDGHVLAQTRL